MCAELCRAGNLGQVVGYSYLGVGGITPSLCYPEYRALAQKSHIEAINSKVGRASMQNHAPPGALGLASETWDLIALGHSIPCPSRCAESEKRTGSLQVTAMVLQRITACRRTIIAVC